jgi:hypothetical protein
MNAQRSQKERQREIKMRGNVTYIAPAADGQVRHKSVAAADVDASSRFIHDNPCRLKRGLQVLCYALQLVVSLNSFKV